MTTETSANFISFEFFSLQPAALKGNNNFQYFQWFLERAAAQFHVRFSGLEL